MRPVSPDGVNGRYNADSAAPSGPADQVQPRGTLGEPETAFDRIVVIFNPQSTGQAPQLAEQLHRDLQQRLPTTPIRLSPTQRAGHARELAREAARTGRPLIVSVSGDGATTRSSTE
jgi:hypothetical protein